VVDERLFGLYVKWHGNVAAVRCELLEAGEPVASLRALQRVFASGLTAAQRASVRDGERGRRAHGLDLRFEAEHQRGLAGRSQATGRARDGAGCAPATHALGDVP
jgi:hypothetical protein